MSDTAYERVPSGGSRRSFPIVKGPQDLSLESRIAVFAYFITLQILVNYDSGAIAVCDMFVSSKFGDHVVAVALLFVYDSILREILAKV